MSGCVRIPFNGASSWRLPPAGVFVATFATSIFFTGLALWVMPVAGTPALPPFWRTYGGGILEIPFFFWAARRALPSCSYLLARTRLAIPAFWPSRDMRRVPSERPAGHCDPQRGYALCGLFAALARSAITGETRPAGRSSGAAAKMTLFSVAAVRARRIGARRWPRHGASRSVLSVRLIIGLINSPGLFSSARPRKWADLVQGLAILVALSPAPDRARGRAH